MGEAPTLWNYDNGVPSSPMMLAMLLSNSRSVTDAGTTCPHSGTAMLEDPKLLLTKAMCITSLDRSRARGTRPRGCPTRGKRLRGALSWQVLGSTFQFQNPSGSTSHSLANRSDWHPSHSTSRRAREGGLGPGTCTRMGPFLHENT